MDPKRQIKVLVVDDEAVVRDFLKRFLNYEGIEADTAGGGYQAIAMAGKVRYDMIFLEVRMPEIDGLQVLKEFKKLNAASMYVMMASNDKDERLEEAKREGAYVCMKKPFDFEEIRSVINRFI